MIEVLDNCAESIIRVDGARMMESVFDKSSNEVRDNDDEAVKS